MSCSRCPGVPLDSSKQPLPSYPPPLMRATMPARRSSPLGHPGRGAGPMLPCRGPESCQDAILASPVPFLPSPPPRPPPSISPIVIALPTPDWKFSSPVSLDRFGSDTQGRAPPAIALTACAIVPCAAGSSPQRVAARPDAASVAPRGGVGADRRPSRRRTPAQLLQAGRRRRRGPSPPLPGAVPCEPRKVLRRRKGTGNR